MNKDMTVTPCIGFYEVSPGEQWGVQVHRISKNKSCSCGGTGDRPCPHIRAVAGYLKAGGERAAEPRLVRKDDPPSSAPVPATCPICDAPIVNEERGRWRCPNSPSHFFWWRGEQNGGAIRTFLTRRHANKVGAFYEQTVEERDAFLSQATRRTYVGGYSPFA